VLRLVEKGEITAYTSTLTWDEVVWVVRNTLGKPDAVLAGRKLLNFPNLRFVPASEDVVRSAQRLVEELGLAPRDAIHLASATSRKVAVLVSDDPDLDAVRSLRRQSPESFLRGR
jgi:predicted nucleic acid-binding protein